MDSYESFLKNKQLLLSPSRFKPTLKFNEALFPFQKDITKWALLKGKACLFEGCGLGKTIQQLEWSRHVAHKEKGAVLIVAPLAVAQQTKFEGKKFGYVVNICSSDSDVKKGINITNYEKLHKFKSNKFCGVVLDESSILKNFSGAVRNQIIEMFIGTPYKLACTATPAPNDYMELGNHAEFLEVMSLSEMLAMFFVNDMSEVGKWRLKKHAAEQKFWEWVCSWAIMMNRPMDLGYPDSEFNLPPLKYIEHIIPTPQSSNYDGFFPTKASTLIDRKKIRKETIEVRCPKAAEIVIDTKDQWVVWCGLNNESKLLTTLIEGGQEVTGSMNNEEKERKLIGFSQKKVHRMITKPTIAGLGMNWQNCHRIVFVGLNDSWEQVYQAIRRIWRFGQKFPVEVHIILEEREEAVLKNIKRKGKQAQHMLANMIAQSKDFMEIQNTKLLSKKIQKEERMELPAWIKTS